MANEYKYTGRPFLKKNIWRLVYSLDNSYIEFQSKKKARKEFKREVLKGNKEIYLYRLSCKDPIWCYIPKLPPTKEKSPISTSAPNYVRNLPTLQFGDRT